MKTLEQMTKGCALVAVKNNGEKVNVFVTDAKNIGKVISSWAHSESIVNPVFEGIRVVEAKASVYRKLMKISKDLNDTVTFASDEEQLKKLSEILADENNLFDVEKIYNETELGKRVVYLVEKEGVQSIVKTTAGRKTATTKKIAEEGYELKGEFTVENQRNLSNVKLSVDDSFNPFVVEGENLEYVNSCVAEAAAKNEKTEETAQGESEVTDTAAE